jgi:hypothetical protein
MTPFLHLQLRNFSTHTIEAYVRAVAQFSKRHGRSPDQLNGEQVRQHLLWLVRERLPRNTDSPTAQIVGNPSANPPQIPVSIAVGIG